MDEEIVDKILKIFELEIDNLYFNLDIDDIQAEAIKRTYPDIRIKLLEL